VKVEFGNKIRSKYQNHGDSTSLETKVKQILATIVATEAKLGTTQADLLHTSQEGEP
jgi:hypothetical protein